MEIYLIRHTTPEIEKGICYGQSDLDVASSFESEVSKILKKVSADTNTKVYSSPLKRCTKLASTFANDIYIDDRLMEINFGDWELKKWDDIPRKESDPWMNDFVNISTPNGEAYKDMFQRVNEAFSEITSHNEGKKIIIATHGGVIRCILSKLQNVSLQNSFDIKVAYGDVFKILKQNNTFTII